MLDIGWSEMAVILMVALIVIGPKDLPRVARTVGKWTAKARGMAREFQRSLDDMAREAELQDIKAEMDKLSRTDVRHRLEETIDPDRSLRRALDPPPKSAGRPLTGDEDEEDAPPPQALPPPPPPPPPAPATTAAAATPPSLTPPPPSSPAPTEKS